jgi:hypothetical protein
MTTSHATIGLRMDSADDVYIIVQQSGPQGTEKQKLYFKRGALPFLFRVILLRNCHVFYVIYNCCRLTIDNIIKDNTWRNSDMISY